MGGIIGALGTGLVVNPAWGGAGVVDLDAVARRPARLGKIAEQAAVTAAKVEHATIRLHCLEQIRKPAGSNFGATAGLGN